LPTGGSNEPRFARAYAAQARAFASAIREDRDVSPNGADARAAFVIAQAAERARREARVVRIEEVTAATTAPAARALAG
jgi:predicted dehydrogenase